MEPISIAKSTLRALGFAKNAYGKLYEKRMEALFSTARKSFESGENIDDETVWRIFEAAMDGDKSE